MWMSMPMPVTNSSQIAESGSSRNPASAWNSPRPPSRVGNVMCPEPLPSQVNITFSNGWPTCVYCVYCNTAPQLIRKARTTTPTQTALTAVLLRRRPKKNMVAAPSIGSRGMIQMFSKKNIISSLPLQQIHVVHVHRLLVTEEGDDDAEPDSGFRCGIGDDEDGEHLPVQVMQARESNQVEVHRVKDQFDRHKHDDHVAAGKHADGADDEQCRGYDQVMQCGDLGHS